MPHIDELINQPFQYELATLKIEKFNDGFMLLVFKSILPEHYQWQLAANCNTVGKSSFTFYSYTFGKRLEFSYSFDEIKKGIELFNSKPKPLGI